MLRVLAVLVSLPLLTLTGCDGYEPLRFDNSFRMRVDGEEVTGRAVFESNAGGLGLPEVIAQAETGTLRIRSAEFLRPALDTAFAPDVGTHYREARGSGTFYSYERGDVRVTRADGGVMEGEFDLVLEGTVAFVIKTRVRARGTFRVLR